MGIISTAINDIVSDKDGNAWIANWRRIGVLQQAENEVFFIRSWRGPFYGWQKD